MLPILFIALGCLAGFGHVVEQDKGAVFLMVLIQHLLP